MRIMCIYNSRVDLLSRLDRSGSQYVVDGVMYLLRKFVFTLLEKSNTFYRRS